MSTAHKVVELVASGLEVVGTFLLAVEAIKLENLKRLREKISKHALRRLIPHILVSEDSTAEEIDKKKERVHMRFLLIFALVGLPLFLLVAIVIADSPSALWLAVHSTLVHPPLWGAIARVLVGVVIAFGISIMFGYVFYLLALAVFTFPVRTLTWIEAHTEKGLIGILGFLIFLLAAGIHGYLTWTAP